MPPYQPPESGDLPEGGKKILRKVYVDCRTNNPGEDPEKKRKCASIAWTAVKNAGYVKKSDGWTKTKESVQAAFIERKLTEGIQPDQAKGLWNKLSEKQTDGMQADFEKERTEHPSFTDSDIWQIVFDHEKAKELTMTDPGLSGTEIATFTKQRYPAGMKCASCHHDFEDLESVFQVPNSNKDIGEPTHLHHCMKCINAGKGRHPMTANTGPVYPAEAGSPILKHFPPTETQKQEPGAKMLESFKWITPFQLIKEGNTRLMKGQAITPGTTRNRVPYTEDELMKGARTLAGKPLLHNHLENEQQARAYLEGRRLEANGHPMLEPDGSPSVFDPSVIPSLVRENIEDMIRSGNYWNGSVLPMGAEYEDGAVEYVAEITRPSAIAMADAGLIKGPSIGAYPRNRSLTHPRGINFVDISMITPPERPADADATMKLIEQVRSWGPGVDELAAESVPLLQERLKVVTALRIRAIDELRVRIRSSHGMNPMNTKKEGEHA